MVARKVAVRQGFAARRDTAEEPLEIDAAHPAEADLFFVVIDRQMRDSRAGRELSLSVRRRGGGDATGAQEAERNRAQARPLGEGQPPSNRRSAAPAADFDATL